MNAKKLFRGPFIWILLALSLFWLSFRIFAGPGVQEVDTSTGLELLRGDTVEQVLITDGQQRVNLVLSEEYEVDGESMGTDLEFYYTEPQGEAVVEAIVAADPPDGYNSEVPQTPWWSTFLLTFLTIALLIGVFWFILSRMQGGGSRMMNFGKSKAKQVTKETPTVKFTDEIGRASCRRRRKDRQRYEGR